MKRLSIFIVLASLIIACQNTGSNSDKPNLVQIGNWSVNTDNMIGTLTGGQSKSKLKTVASTQAEGDTTFFEAPDGQNIQIYDASDPNPEDPKTRFGFQYVDSTYGRQFFDTTEAKSSGIIYTPFAEVDTSMGSWGVGVDEPKWIAAVQIPFDCDSTYTFENEYIKVHMLKDDGSFYQAFHFKAQGMIETARFVVCNDSL